MMENSKVKMQDVDCETFGYRTNKNCSTYEIEDKSILSPIQNKWLNKVCSVIKQNDFDTCRSSYSDGNYDIRNGYRQSYNTYLDQFENC